jgi:hypothetical protein
MQFLFIVHVQMQICSWSNQTQVALGDLVLIVLAIEPKIRGFKAGRRRWIFKGDKGPKHDFLRRESKAFYPMSQDFPAC